MQMACPLNRGNKNGERKGNVVEEDIGRAEFLLDIPLAQELKTNTSLKQNFPSLLASRSSHILKRGNVV